MAEGESTELVADSVGKEVISIHPWDTVATAARRLVENGIGCLTVVDGDGCLLGIVSERDIVRRIVAPALDPGHELVDAIMTPEVACCSAGDSMDTAQNIMASRGIRHLPVTEDGTVVGIISIREVMAHRQARDEAAHDLTIFALAKLTESRDPETGLHLDRVCRYSTILAQHLAKQEKFSDQIDADFVRLIYISSPLHDIGKVSIPDCVLLKPDRLDDREFEIMKSHASVGAETISSVLERFPGAEFLRMARDIAAAHHERPDGEGYPCGLKGDDIPLAARIFAPADVYDALVSKRVYKNAFSHDIAKNIIIEGSGTQFDSDACQAFLNCQQQFQAVRDHYDDTKAAA